MAGELQRLLTRDALRRMAGQRSFERGVGYSAAQKVRNLVQEGDAITATVRGTHKYTATLGVIDGALEYDCNCPHARDGNFCKHCVALGLVWLDHEAAPAKEKAITRKDVRKWLESRQKKDLVELLLEQAKTDERLSRVLMLEAARAMGGAVNRVAFERALDDALEWDPFGGWGDRYEYGRDIDEVVDSIEGLLAEGLAADVVELAETALARVESAMANIDDSDGQLGMILDRLQSLHLKACKRAHPDPVALAERLFEGELQTGFDTFYDAVHTYASVLGTEGITRHRQLLEEAWKRVPERKPGNHGTRNARHATVTRMMETLAEQSGDLEALVAVRSRDLSTPWAFLKIAEMYRDAGCEEQALEWAENGLSAFPERANDDLRLFLAGEYQKRKRHSEAMELIWGIFAEHPALERYKVLKQHAKRCGQWTGWRDKALALIREQIQQRKQQRGRLHRYWEPRDHSALVEIFLWERKPDLAWEEASAGGCTGDLWLRLAAKQEEKHPEDALEVYRRLIDPIVGRKDKDAYREAVNLMKKIRALLERLGRAAEFSPYVMEVRKAHRPKRNFMALLDAAGWTAAQ